MTPPGTHCKEASDDDAQHTSLSIRIDGVQRSSLIKVVGEIAPDNVIGKMLGTKERWEKVRRDSVTAKEDGGLTLLAVFIYDRQSIPEG